MLGKLSLQVCFVAIDILPLEVDGSSDVEIVEEVGDVQ
jgi:hypothetical protein